jgi:hypothetical protein
MGSLIATVNSAGLFSVTPDGNADGDRASTDMTDVMQ